MNFNRLDGIVNTSLGHHGRSNNTGGTMSSLDEQRPHARCYISARHWRITRNCCQKEGMKIVSVQLFAPHFWLYRLTRWTAWPHPSSLFWLMFVNLISKFCQHWWVISSWNLSQMKSILWIQCHSIILLLWSNSIPHASTLFKSFFHFHFRWIFF